MIILGLDPSQKTGWALYDTKANVSAIRCGVLKIDAEKKKFEQNAGKLGFALMKLLTERRDPTTGRPILPDFAVIEKAPRRPYGGGGEDEPTKGKTTRFMGQEIPAQDGDEEEGKGPGLQGTLSTNQMTAALCAILGAYKIPFVEVTPAEWRKPSYGFGTRKGWTRKEWKRHSREKCAQVRITATNDDMAEACWIAYAGPAQQAFKYLQANLAAEPAKPVKQHGPSVG